MLEDDWVSNRSMEVDFFSSFAALGGTYAPLLLGGGFLCLSIPFCRVSWYFLTLSPLQARVVIFPLCFFLCLTSI